MTAVDHPILETRREGLQDALGLESLKTVDADTTTHLYKPSGFDGREHQGRWYDTTQVEALTGRQVPVGFSDLEKSLKDPETDLASRVYIARPGEVAGSTVKTNHYRVVAPQDCGEVVKVVLVDTYGNAFSIEEQERIEASIRKKSGKPVELCYVNKSGRVVPTTECAVTDLAVLQHGQDMDNCGPLTSLACTTLAKTDFTKDTPIHFKIDGKDIDLETGASRAEVNSLRSQQQTTIAAAGAKPVREWDSPENSHSLLLLIVDWLCGGDTTFKEVLSAITSSPVEVRAATMRMVNDPDIFRQAQEELTKTDVKDPRDKATIRLDKPSVTGDHVAKQHDELYASMNQLKEAVREADSGKTTDGVADAEVKKKVEKGDDGFGRGGRD